MRDTAATSWLVVALSACGGAAEPKRVPLGELVQDQQRYSDQQVVTSGVVLRQRDAERKRYYVLSDRSENLVALEPAREAAPYRGRRVTVTGVFELDPRSGRTIRFQRIQTGGP